MMLTVFFYVFVAATVIQIGYYLSFSFFAFSKESIKKKQQKTPVSVIICAKNEAENLQKFLPSIVQQKYADFEIVLINDASSDTTLEVMKNFKKNHKNIRIVNVKNNEAFWGNKKYALTLGIKAAKHEHLLFTDADCKSVSVNWIDRMTQHFTDEKTIVLGYGKYETTKNSFVNLLVRFETLLTAIQYFSYAKLQNPYMGVGRNLAYTKSEFFKTNGFIKHIKLRSGDDDLFIQQAANKKNTCISTHPDSFTISIPPKTLYEWFRQKRRHISTASHYKVKHQFLLGLFFISKVFFLSFAIPMLFLFSSKIIVPFITSYYLILFLVVGFSAKKLEEKQLIYYLPFLEFFLILFQFSIFIANSISKPAHWK